MLDLRPSEISTTTSLVASSGVLQNQDASSIFAQSWMYWKICKEQMLVNAAFEIANAPRFSLKTATFAMIAPIEIFATLQRLDLVPGWPLLPHLWGAVPLTVFGPFQRTTSNTALVNHATAFLTSPVVLLWILLYVKQQVDERLFLYIRLALPKPSGPDLDSIEAAVMEDLNNSHILGLGRCNARQQIKDDLGKLYSNFQGFRAASMSWTPWENMRWTHITTLDSATEGPSDPQNLSSGYASNDGIQLLDSDGVVDLNSTVHPTSPQQDALEDSLAQSTVSPGSPEAAELSQELQAVFMADSNNGSQASAAFNESEENISSTECLRGRHLSHRSQCQNFLELLSDALVSEEIMVWQWFKFEEIYPCREVVQVQNCRSPEKNCLFPQILLSSKSLKLVCPC